MRERMSQQAAAGQQAPAVEQGGTQKPQYQRQPPKTRTVASCWLFCWLLVWRWEFVTLYFPRLTFLYSTYGALVQNGSSGFHIAQFLLECVPLSGSSGNSTEKGRMHVETSEKRQGMSRSFIITPATDKQNSREGQKPGGFMNPELISRRTAITILITINFVSGQKLNYCFAVTPVIFTI